MLGEVHLQGVLELWDLRQGPRLGLKLHVLALL